MMFVNILLAVYMLVCIVVGAKANSVSLVNCVRSILLQSVMMQYIACGDDR